MAAIEEEQKKMEPTLIQSFLSARKAIKNPAFDAENTMHSKIHKYASLKSVIESVIGLAAEEGIAVMQDLQEAEGGVRCVTHLLHESGEEKVFGPLFFPSNAGTAHGYASASTYARRYHLLSIFCVVGDEDDDGNTVSRSAFDNKAHFTKVRNKMLKAAENEDLAILLDLSRSLNNDQKPELHMSFTHQQKALVKDAMELVNKRQTTRKNNATKTAI